MPTIFIETVILAVHGRTGAFLFLDDRTSQASFWAYGTGTELSKCRSNMGKKKAASKKTIARLDKELLALINERAKRLQRSNQPRSPMTSTTIESLTAANKGPLLPEHVAAIFGEIHSACHSLTNNTRVAFLGPMYSYSYLAAVERFGSSAELVAVGTIQAVFEEVDRDQSQFGIVPLENSTDGRVVDTLGMFARLPMQICGEVKLEIHHQLLAKCNREQIREVYSKPQALSQCRQWLAKHVPNARPVEMASTTAAAKLAGERNDAAAIASRQAGIQYGLQVVAGNIEDNPNNVTRFAVIGRQPAARSGTDKTALMFEIPHQPGSLSGAMNGFQSLNLTWIESFPMPGSKNEYLFFVEFEGHADDAKVKRALTALRKKTVQLTVLGSFPAAE